MNSIVRWSRRLDAFAVPLTIVGLFGAGLFNLFRWRGDDRRAAWLRQGRTSERPAFARIARVSVLVAAWNEAETLEQHLRSVRALRYPNLEYVICAGGSDHTLALAYRYAPTNAVVLEQQAGEGQTRAAARCFEASSGEIVFITDADCLLNDASFEWAILPIINEGEVAVAGNFEPLAGQLSNDFVLHRWAATLYRRLKPLRHVEGLTGADSAVRADVLRASGALAEPNSIGMDYFISSRLLAAGHQIAFAPFSAVGMAFESDFSRYSVQRGRWLRNILYHAIRFGRWSDVPVVAMFYAVGLATVCLPVLAPLFGRWLLSLWLVGLMLAMGNRARYLRFAHLATGVRVSAKTYARILYFVPRDLAALAYSPLELVAPWRWSGA